MISKIITLLRICHLLTVLRSRGDHKKRRNNQYKQENQLHHQLNFELIKISVRVLEGSCAAVRNEFLMKDGAFLFKCPKVFFLLLFVCFFFFQFNFLFVENHHYFPLTPFSHSLCNFQSSNCYLSSRNYCFEVIFLSFRFHNSRLPVLTQHPCFSIVRLQ